MAYRKKRVWAAVFLLICAVVFFTGKTLVSEAGSGQRAERELYHQMEKAYVKETRQALEEAGFVNSGVNLTKVIDQKGERIYFMKIHNGRINALKEPEKEELLAKLKGVNFADAECEFYHEFISADDMPAKNQ